jgi:hypothetical protein
MSPARISRANVALEQAIFIAGIRSDRRRGAPANATEGRVR